MARPKKYTDTVINDFADKLSAWWDEDPNRYWLKDFAIENGLHSQSLSEFANKSEKFSEALKRSKEIQESRLVKMGFDKSKNCTMAIFALKNVAGWRDHENETQLTETELIQTKKMLSDFSRNNT